MKYVTLLIIGAGLTFGFITLLTKEAGEGVEAAFSFLFLASVMMLSANASKPEHSIYVLTCVALLVVNLVYFYLTGLTE